MNNDEVLAKFEDLNVWRQGDVVLVQPELE